MIRIHTLDDLLQLEQSGVNPLVETYIKKYLCTLLDDTKCLNISHFATLYYWECKEDSTNFKATNLFEPITQLLPEYVHCVTIKCNDLCTDIIQAVFNLSDGYSICIFTTVDNLADNVKAFLLQEAVKMEVYIDGYYTIQITETLQKSIAVEAKTESEALEIVKCNYNNGNPVLDSSNFISVDFSVISKNILKEMFK